MDSMGNRVSHSNRASYGVGDRVCDGSTNNIRVSSSAFIGHLSNVASDVIGVVVNVQDPSIREVDRVRARDSSSSIIGLRLSEVSTRIVIRHSILVVVRRGLSEVIHISYSVSYRMSNSSVNHRTGNCMGNRVGNNWVGNSYWCVGNNSMTNNSMTNNSMSYKSMTKASTSKKLRADRCHSQESGTDKGLHYVLETEADT